MVFLIWNKGFETFKSIINKEYLYRKGTYKNGFGNTLLFCSLKKGPWHQLSTPHRISAYPTSRDNRPSEPLIFPLSNHFLAQFLTWKDCATQLLLLLGFRSWQTTRSSFATFSGRKLPLGAVYSQPAWITISADDTTTLGRIAIYSFLST